MSRDEERTPVGDEQRERQVLVVLDEDAAPTLRAALQDCDPAATTFHLLLVTETRTFERRRRAYADPQIPGEYTLGKAAEEARRSAARIGREYFKTDSSAFEATGKIGREEEQIAMLVDDREFERVYVPQRERSLVQRLFGTEALAARLERTLPDEIEVEAVDSATPVVDQSEAETSLPASSRDVAGS